MTTNVVIPPTVGRVVLYYPAGQSPTTGQRANGHARWMPYQMGQAARTEAAEAKVVNPEAGISCP